MRLTIAQLRHDLDNGKEKIKAGAVCVCHNNEVRFRECEVEGLPPGATARYDQESFGTQYQLDILFSISTDDIGIHAL